MSESPGPRGRSEAFPGLWALPRNLFVSSAYVDAVRLATALVWQDRMCQSLVVATHDRDLALAARSFGFEIRGV